MLVKYYMFSQFGFSKNLLKAIAAAGFEKPSLIQEKVMPHISEGRDLIGQAKTGTGKTAAFGLPSLEKIDAGKPQVQMLVIAPTRELATQVCDELQKFGRFLGIKCACISGGNSYARQIEAVKSGAQVIVATPGRLLDLINSRRIPKLNPTVVVLDEADEMLDMGFLDDIQAIFDTLPPERQTLMFSATMPAPIQKLARKILKDPLFITTQDGKEMTNQDIQQEAYIVEEREREHALVRLLEAYKPFKSIVFCRTRSDVDHLSRALSDSGFAAAPLHGDLEQRQRERVLGGLKEGRVQVLVATDVAARGLNVSDVTHVFNYHLPHGTENYVHRIGRTGRAGNKGLALTLVTPSEFRRFKTIQSGSGTTINAKRIPSLQDVKKTKLVEFSRTLENQPVSKDARMFLDTLGAGVDSEITLKLLTMVMGDFKVAGPERIGLDPEALKNHEERPRRDRDDRRPRGKFGPPGKKRFFKGRK